MLRKKVSHLMLMNSGNEIPVGGGLRALPLLAAFCGLKWKQNNMLTDVDMPVALATSVPVFGAAARNAASGTGPICFTNCSICLYLFFCAWSVGSLSPAHPLLWLSDCNICHCLLLLYVHSAGATGCQLSAVAIVFKYSFTCEKLFH